MYKPITEKKGKKNKLFDLRKFNKAPQEKQLQIPKSKPLVYHDKEKNETLYGYSQHNLDNFVNLLRLLVIIFGIISIVMFFLTLYVFYIFQKYHVLTQIVQAL